MRVIFIACSTFVTAPHFTVKFSSAIIFKNHSRIFLSRYEYPAHIPSSPLKPVKNLKAVLIMLGGMFRTGICAVRTHVSAVRSLHVVPRSVHVLPVSTNLYRNWLFPQGRSTMLSQLKQVQSVIEPEASEEDNTIYTDSVLRKRRLKMKKHKLRKRRKEQRALTKKLGK